MGVMEVLTGALVVITAVYAYLTHKMASASQATLTELREQSWNASRPRILVEPHVRPHTTLFYLVIRNVGQGTATDLSLTLDKEFWQFGEQRPNSALHQKRAFREALDAFHPRQELRFALAQGWKILQSAADQGLCPAQFTVVATYSYLGRKIRERFLIDLSVYAGSEGERFPIVEELERLRAAIEKRAAV